MMFDLSDCSEKKKIGRIKNHEGLKSFNLAKIDKKTLPKMELIKLQKYPHLLKKSLKINEILGKIVIK